MVIFTFYFSDFISLVTLQIPVFSSFGDFFWFSISSFFIKSLVLFLVSCSYILKVIILSSSRSFTSVSLNFSPVIVALFSSTDTIQVIPLSSERTIRSTLLKVMSFKLYTCWELSLLMCFHPSSFHQVFLSPDLPPLWVLERSMGETQRPKRTGGGWKR